MRWLYILILAMCALAVISAAGTLFGSADPRATAEDFVKALRSGNMNHATEIFGNIACTCPPKGGYGQYLRYESATTPNLAFLVGKPFSFDSPRLIYRRYVKKIDAWEQPEETSITTTLNFDQGYSPLFLPVAMSCGHQLSQQDFEKFNSNPADEADRGLSLRLRPSVQPGVVKSHTPANKDEASAMASGNVWPSDSGAVKSADGKVMDSKQVESKLPRLLSLELKLNIVRRGNMKDWTLDHFSFDRALLESQGSKFRVQAQAAGK